MDEATIGLDPQSRRDLLIALHVEAREDRFAEHSTSGVTHLFNCVRDAVYRDDDGRVLGWPVWLSREETTVDRSGLLGTAFVSLGRGCKKIVPHCVAERLGLPAKRPFIEL